MSWYRLVLMIGLSGSGKSTQARLLQEGSPLTSVIHSIDSYFMANGKYCYEASLMPKYIRRCFEDVELSMRKYTELVIVDNTNLRIHSRKGYFDLAYKYGYNYSAVPVGLFTSSALPIYERRNVHGVNRRLLERMLRTYQPPEPPSYI